MKHSRSESDQPMLWSLGGHPDSPSCSATPTTPSGVVGGGQRRDDGLARVRSHGDNTWLRRACVALDIIIRSGQHEVTSDDVWECLERDGVSLPTTDHRLMGVVFRERAMDGTLVNTYRVRKSNRAACNRRPISIWRIVR